MKNYKFIKILFLIIILLLGNFSISNASSSGIGVDLHVGSCNNNGICEAGEEDMFSCPADCTPIIIPPEPPQPGGGSHGSGGSSLPMDTDNVFKNLTVLVSYNSVIIKWDSVIPTMSNLKWGTSPDYKDGIISNTNFILNHKVEITNLHDGTVYYFSIQSGNLLGKTNTLENQVFRTLSLPDTTPPGNPTNVKAESTLPGITVSWLNPLDPDFDYVRVMRNTDRFYGSPNLGHLVYEGKGMYFTDGNVVKDNIYYYSLFGRDRAGNYSSGSLISARYNSSGSFEADTNIIPKEIPPLENIYKVFQESFIYDLKIGSVISLSGDVPIDIKTNYSPKTKNDDMWVEIRDKDMSIVGQYFFFRNKDKDGFMSVTIPSFNEGGYYNISIYRFSNGVTQIVNEGAFKISKVLVDDGANNYWYIFWWIIIILFPLLILLLLILLFSRRFQWFKKGDKNKELTITD